MPEKKKKRNRKRSYENTREGSKNLELMMGHVVIGTACIIAGAATGGVALVAFTFIYTVSAGVFHLSAYESGRRKFENKNYDLKETKLIKADAKKNQKYGKNRYKDNSLDRKIKMAAVIHKKEREISEESRDKKIKKVRRLNAKRVKLAQKYPRKNSNICETKKAKNESSYSKSLEKLYSKQFKTSEKFSSKRKNAFEGSAQKCNRGKIQTSSELFNTSTKKVVNTDKQNVSKENYFTSDSELSSNFSMSSTNSC